MNSYLLNRALGSISPGAFERVQNERLLHALQPAPGVKLHCQPVSADARDGDDLPALAHPAGVNAITIDRFEGRYLLSGGADSSILIWDLEASSVGARPDTLSHQPLGAVQKTSNSKFGITALSFYPFDSLAFLSSSYDHTLRIYSSETLAASASFDLASVVYSHATSPIASHLLVACATQHPAVRLVDLRSGANTHSLAGHSGTVLTVGWSPRHEHILASGGTDGTVRFWDVRRSAGGLGLLDMEDSVGISGLAGHSTGARRRDRGKAHAGVCNGLVWTEDGRHVVTVGHDEKVRVWDTSTGANTLASFGPTVRNKQLSTLLPVLAPAALASPGRDVMFYPNEKEILMYELFDGRLIKRLRPAVSGRQEQQDPAPSTQIKRQRNLVNRTTAMSWRPYDIELYSAHSDGVIRAWRPRTSEDALADEEEAPPESGLDENEQDGIDANETGSKRKRDVLDEIYRDFTRQKITFS